MVPREGSQGPQERLSQTPMGRLRTAPCPLALMSFPPVPLQMAWPTARIPSVVPATLETKQSLCLTSQNAGHSVASKKERKKLLKNNSLFT